MLFVLAGAAIGYLLWQARGALIWCLLIGALYWVAIGIWHLPARLEARGDIHVVAEPVQTAQYEWKVAYRLSNDDTGYRVTSLSFDCDGGKTDEIDDQDMEPGRQYVGYLAVPYAEHLRDCRPHYSVERIDE